MKTISKKLTMATLGLVLSFSIIGCSSNTYDSKLVEAKVLKKNGGKYLEDIEISSEYVSTEELVKDMPIETYSYTLKAKVAKTYCQGTMMFNKCHGKTIKAGTVIDKQGSIKMSALDALAATRSK